VGSSGCKHADQEGEEGEPEPPFGEMDEILEYAETLLVDAEAYLVSHQ